MSEQIIIRITGDSGDGVQLVCEQLTITAALSGRDVRTLPDFPAEIRAPAGTVAGVSGFQIAMANKEIFTAGEVVDVLVALNPAAILNSIQYLKSGGLLIVNEDSLQDKDWIKAGANADYLDKIAEHYQIISLPLITHTLEAVKDIDITITESKKAKNFYVLGLVLWLFDLSLKHCQQFIDKKFQQKPFIGQANMQAMQAGYNYAVTLELSRKDFVLDKVSRPPGEYRQVTGIDAVGMAVAAVSTITEIPLLVSGYPITPASAILHTCAKLNDYGIQLLQAEDEIAAICACIGAAFGGRLAMTCTSGPGLDLKSESLGLAVVSELPIVVVDVQRAGASTGLPTKTGQSDLNQALYGRHGEAPLPVIAARSPSDCFLTIIEAFSIAINYMTPVIVLLDAYLSNAAEPWRIPDVESLPINKIKFNQEKLPFKRNDNLSRSWNVPGTTDFIHQLGGLEKEGDAGRVSYDANNHQKMIDIRAKKIAGIAKTYPKTEIEGDILANVLIIGWGSTYGSLKTVIETMNNDGKSIALIHLRNLNPLPNDLAQIMKQYKQVLVAELNTGHLCNLLRAKYLIDAKSITQCNGQPFTTSGLITSIDAELNNG